MNDPNGPIFFNGRYHMFFQYNPKAPVWGEMSWYHSVSPDMLHWTHLPLAFTPTPDSPDAFGCFSGSAIAVGKGVYVVYTGTRESTKELATAAIPAQTTGAGVVASLPKATGEFLFYTRSRKSSLQLTLTAGGAELTRLLYSPEKHAFVIGGHEVPLEPEDTPSVHGFVGGSVVELILGERIGHTRRFYYNDKVAPDVAIIATGAAAVGLEAWKIAPISPNRLTTPART